MSRPSVKHVSIESLAPTGEGVARTEEGVGFVAGALPGEEVEAEVLEVRKRFWKGRVLSIATPSPSRASGPHALGCAACDWAHLEPEVAREAKRGLFLDTMERIGELSKDLFGELPIAASPSGYRLRARFHVAGRGAGTEIGFFAPRTHRVESADGCEALGPGLRALLTEVRSAVAESGAAVVEIATVETRDGSRRIARATVEPGASRADANRLLSLLEPLFDGIEVRDGPSLLASAGERRVWIEVGGRQFPATPDAFFQANRYLVEELYRDVAREAASVSPSRALDAFGGVGLFAGACLDAGHSVVTVEGDATAVGLALEARRRAGVSAEKWAIERAAALPFLARRAVAFGFAVLDPPRAGLGLKLAALLPGAVSRVVYVSCDPATLARDLSALTGGGFAIRGARLYDFFAGTHRVEAAVVLDRASRA